VCRSALLDIYIHIYIYIYIYIYLIPLYIYITFLKDLCGTGILGLFLTHRFHRNTHGHVLPNRHEITTPSLTYTYMLARARAHARTHKYTLGVE